MLDGETATVWMEDDALKGVNALPGDADRMLVSTMTAGHLVSVDPDRNATLIASGMKNGDGIGRVCRAPVISCRAGEARTITPSRAARSPRDSARQATRHR